MSKRRSSGKRGEEATGRAPSLDGDGASVMRQGHTTGELSSPARFTTRRVTRIAVLAALYAVFTWGIAPVSYGPIQFRVSEVLKILVLFDPWLVLGIGIGTLVANLTSPYVGPWELVWMPFSDMAGGLLAWALYRLARGRWPVVPMVVYGLTTGLAVAWMLWALGLGGFWFLAATVAASELAILVGGVPLMFWLEQVLEKRGIGLRPSRGADRPEEGCP